MFTWLLIARLLCCLLSVLSALYCVFFLLFTAGSRCCLLMLSQCPLLFTGVLSLLFTECHFCCLQLVLADVHCVFSLLFTAYSLCCLQRVLAVVYWIASSLLYNRKNTIELLLVNQFIWLFERSALRYLHNNF